MTPEEAVADYILRFRVLARAEMRAFEKEPTLHDAIRRAALCVWPNGKRHEHQYLIAKPLLEQAEGRLQAMARKLAHAADFAALHDLVEDEIGRLHGIGPLTIYDIAHRVGAYLKKAPKLVYLHSGTKIGAAVFGLRGRTIDPANLPSAFSRLTPAEIEDCLCIYRHELRKGHNTILSRASPRPRPSSCRPRIRGCNR